MLNRREFVKGAVTAGAFVSVPVAGFATAPEKTVPSRIFVECVNACARDEKYFYVVKHTRPDVGHYLCRAMARLDGMGINKWSWIYTEDPYYFQWIAGEKLHKELHALLPHDVRCEFIDIVMNVEPMDLGCRAAVKEIVAKMRSGELTA